MIQEGWHNSCAFAGHIGTVTKNINQNTRCSPPGCIDGLGKDITERIILVNFVSKFSVICQSLLNRLISFSDPPKKPEDVWYSERYFLSHVWWNLWHKEWV